METPTGMEAFWTAALAAITPDKLWGVLTAAIGMIAVIFVFVFGYRLVRKLFKGGSKGNLRV